MGDKQVRRIPVVDGGGNLRGIISMADVALETEEDRELADALEEISSGASFWSKIFG
jgi:CBS domain-containing protein